MKKKDTHKQITNQILIQSIPLPSYSIISDILFAIYLASNKSHTMPRQNVSSGSKFEEEIGYSRAVVVDDWIFVSGTTG